MDLRVGFGGFVIPAVVTVSDTTSFGIRSTNNTSRPATIAELTSVSKLNRLELVTSLHHNYNGF